jgi:hypothetical protein
MQPLAVINVIANAVVVGAVFWISLRVFGNPAHPLHRHKIAFVTRKLVSSVVICGAVLNIITLSTPTWTEVVLNVGFSLNYLWSTYYDRIANSKHPASGAKVHKRNAPSRAANTPKTKPRAASRRN